jgi:hypothetical protein
MIQPFFAGRFLENCPGAFFLLFRLLLGRFWRVRCLLNDKDEYQ